MRGSGRLWSSSEGSDRTDGAAAGWEACGLRGYGVLKRAPLGLGRSGTRLICVGVRAVESKLSPPFLHTDSPCRRPQTVSKRHTPSVLRSRPARSPCGAVWMPEAGSSSGVNDRRAGSQPPAGDPAFS